MLDVHPPAPRDLVLRDQFDWLLRHVAGCRSKEAGCRNCERLAAIERVLLQPFRPTSMMPWPFKRKPQVRTSMASD